MKVNQLDVNKLEKVLNQGVDEVLDTGEQYASITVPLNEVLSGVQVQIHITRDPEEFIDCDSSVITLKED